MVFNISLISSTRSSSACDGDVLTAVTIGMLAEEVTGAVEGRKGEGDLLRLIEGCK